MPSTKQKQTGSVECLSSAVQWVSQENLQLVAKGTREMGHGEREKISERDRVLLPQRRACQGVREALAGLLR